MNDKNINELSYSLIQVAMKVHSKLGPGLLESAYEECLWYEIKKAGIHAEKQKVLPLIYEDVYIDRGYRIDILVSNAVVIEIKAVESINEIHIAQLLTYLKLSKCKLGLIINFNVSSLKNGIKRVIL